MDTIINRINEIEKRASAIVENAHKEKQKLISDSERERKEYADILSGETQSAIKEIYDKADSQTNERISKIRADAKKRMAEIASDYNENKEKYVDEIFEKITGA